MTAVPSSRTVTTVQNHILSSYSPTGRRIMIIFPCSAKKPYSTSQSQRLYRNAVRVISGDSFGLISFATLSGIFGVVPDEFEGLRACLDYDFNLNRAPGAAAMVQAVADSASLFLRRHGAKFSSVIGYGRERYRRVLEAVNDAGLVVRILPSRNKRLTVEGLEELQDALSAELSFLSSHGQDR